MNDETTIRDGRKWESSLIPGHSNIDGLFHVKYEYGRFYLRNSTLPLTFAVGANNLGYKLIDGHCYVVSLTRGDSLLPVLKEVIMDTTTGERF